MAGRMLVQNHCYRADEMLLMLDVAREMGFRSAPSTTPWRPTRSPTCWPARAVAAATWSDWWGFKMEAYDGIPENLALVHAAGARAIVHSDSPVGIQRLNQAAAQGLAVGKEMGLTMDEQDALRWITANPAWALGVEGSTGTLEVGKMADLVVWSHLPLSVYAHPEQVYRRRPPGVRSPAGRAPLGFRAGHVASRGAGPVIGAGVRRQIALLARVSSAAPRPRRWWRSSTRASTPVTARPSRTARMVVRNGAVAALGPAASVTIPAGARRIDGKGLWLTPGFIDAESSTGLADVYMEKLDSSRPRSTTTTTPSGPPSRWSTASTRGRRPSPPPGSRA